MKSLLIYSAVLSLLFIGILCSSDNNISGRLTKTGSSVGGSGGCTY